MARIGETYRCSAGSNCDRGHEGIYPDEMDEEYDGIGIYAGLWHPECWERFGSSYRNYTRADAAANGETIGDEDW